MADIHQVLGGKQYRKRLLLANVGHTPIFTLYGAR